MASNPVLAPGLTERLRRGLPEEALLFGDDVRRRSSNVWGTPRPIEAEVLIRPASTRELSRALAICNSLSQPVVVHGGQTGVVGSTATTPGDVIIALERMAAIEEVDIVGRTMTVQAGVTLQKAQEEAASHGLFLGIDLGARGSATLGGNAATNAGGNRVIRYGMTRRHVLGMEAVLADGTVLSSMGKIIKDNAGFDLKQLFIGSEGALGVIAKLVLQLLPAPRTVNTAMVTAPTFDAVSRLLGALNGDLGSPPSAFEVLWSDYYALVTTPPAASRPPIAQGHGFYVLVECHGSDETFDNERFVSSLSRAIDSGLIDDAVIAQSEAERASLWAVRDDVHQLMRVQPMFLFDVGVPISRMEGYVENLRSALQARWPQSLLYVFGHIGDGNLHVCVSAGLEDGSALNDVERLVYAPLAAFSGSVSAEHGIGFEKKAYLGITRSAAEIDLMRKLKALLDPRNILNRGRVFDL
jgi:FAD/FMN-containing dehydrogenase